MKKGSAGDYSVTSTRMSAEEVLRYFLMLFSSSQEAGLVRVNTPADWSEEDVWEYIRAMTCHTKNSMVGDIVSDL